MKARHLRPRCGGTPKTHTHHLRPRVGTTVYKVSLVEHSPRAGVIWSGTTQVRARPWPHAPHKAFLLINGSHNPSITLPEPTIVQSWVSTLSSWGYSSVRTSALTPAAAATLSLVGFSVAQELALLEVDHRAIPTVALQPHFSLARATRLARSVSQSRRTAILALDQEAFGNEWAMDTATFTEALCATRRVEIFLCHSPQQLVGFVIVGATGTNGFIQRLAVHPSARRTGVASALIATALAWSNRRGCTSTVVNTEVSNVAALGTYKKFGFIPLDNGLSVLEMTLSS